MHFAMASTFSNNFSSYRLKKVYFAQYFDLIKCYVRGKIRFSRIFQQFILQCVFNHRRSVAFSIKSRNPEIFLQLCNLVYFIQRFFFGFSALNFILSCLLLENLYFDFLTKKGSFFGPTYSYYHSLWLPSINSYSLLKNSILTSLSNNLMG